MDLFWFCLFSGSNDYEKYKSRQIITLCVSFFLSVRPSVFHCLFLLRFHRRWKIVSIVFRVKRVLAKCNNTTNQTNNCSSSNQPTTTMVWDRPTDRQTDSEWIYLIQNRAENCDCGENYVVQNRDPNWQKQNEYTNTHTNAHSQTDG